MIIFDINPTARLICGNSGWEIQKKVNNKAMDEGFQWVGEKWFSTLGGACKELGNRVCREANTLEEALAKLEELGKRILDSRLYKLYNDGNEMEETLNG